MKQRENIVINLVGQGVSAALGVLALPFIIKYLGSERYAIVGVYSIILAGVSMLDFGITPTIKREVAKRDLSNFDDGQILSLIRSSEIVTIVIAFMIVIIVNAFHDFLFNYWLGDGIVGESETSPALFCISLVVAAKFIESIYRGILSSTQKYMQLNFANVIVAIFRWVGGSIVAYKYRYQIVPFFEWQVFVSICSLMMMILFSYSSIGMRLRGASFSCAALIKHKKFASAMSGLTILAFISMQVDKILTSKILSLSEFGDYAFSANLSAGIAFLTMPICQSFYPNIVKASLKESLAEKISPYLKASSIVSVFIVPIAISTAYYVRDILVFFGSELIFVERVSTSVSVLMLASVFLSYATLQYNFNLAMALTRNILLSYVFLIIAQGALLIFLADRYKLLGAAMAVAVSGFCLMIFNAAMLSKIISYKNTLKWCVDFVLFPCLISFFTCYLLDVIFIGGLNVPAVLALFVSLFGSIGFTFLKVRGFLRKYDV